MHERGPGVIITLTLVTLSALLVAFGSSARAKSGETHLETLCTQISALQGQVTDLKLEIDQLHQDRFSLETRVQEAQDEAILQLRTAKGLEKTLAQEQWRNKTLSKQLDEQRVKISKLARAARSSNLSAR